jgi:hypothetical protein
MPYQNTWLLQDKVMLARMWGTFTDEEFLAYDAEAVRILDASASSWVHTIQVMDHVHIHQPKISLAVQMKASRHPKVGWTVILGVENPVLRFLIRVAASTAGTRVRHVNTLEIAVQYLISVDPSVEALRQVDIRAHLTPSDAPPH